jgi:DNA-binding NtrC family response regulator
VGPGLTLDEADFHRPYKDAKADRLDEFERAYWTRMLAEHGGNITRAAEAGGLHRKSLEYLLRKHGMDRGAD